MNFDKFSAFVSLRPTSSFEIHEDGTVNWLDENTTIPTDAEVTAEIANLEANYTATQAAKAQHKQNAVAKLTALGLTADEISALGK